MMSPSSSASKTAPKSSFPRLRSHSRIPPPPIARRTSESGNNALARLPFIAQLPVALRWFVPQYMYIGLGFRIYTSPVRRAPVDKHSHATASLAQSASRPGIPVGSSRTRRKDTVLYRRQQDRLSLPPRLPASKRVLALSLCDPSLSKNC